LSGPVLSDASPLIALEQIGRLGLLAALYGSIGVPPAVAGEVRDSVPLPSWIQVKHHVGSMPAHLRRSTLDRGEQELLWLAHETGASRVLIDEQPARKMARTFGMRVTGTLGVLLAAKRAGHVSDVRSLVDNLVATRFFLTPELYDRIISDAGER
jgi:uncharacterized protein